MNFFSALSLLLIWAKITGYILVGWWVVVLPLLPVLAYKIFKWVILLAAAGGIAKAFSEVCKGINEEHE